MTMGVEILKQKDSELDVLRTQLTATLQLVQSNNRTARTSKKIVMNIDKLNGDVSYFPSSQSTSLSGSVASTPNKSKKLAVYLSTLNRPKSHRRGNGGTSPSLTRSSPSSSSNAQTKDISKKATNAKKSVAFGSTTASISSAPHILSKHKESTLSTSLNESRDNKHVIHSRRNSTESAPSEHQAQRRASARRPSTDKNVLPTHTANHVPFVTKITPPVPPTAAPPTVTAAATQSESAKTRLSTSALSRHSQSHGNVLSSTPGVKSAASSQASQPLRRKSLSSSINQQPPSSTHTVAPPIPTEIQCHPPPARKAMSYPDIKSRMESMKAPSRFPEREVGLPAPNDNENQYVHQHPAPQSVSLNHMFNLSELLLTSSSSTMTHFLPAKATPFRMTRINEGADPDPNTLGSPSFLSQVLEVVNNESAIRVIELSDSEDGDEGGRVKVSRSKKGSTPALSPGDMTEEDLNDIEVKVSPFVTSRNKKKKNKQYTLEYPDAHKPTSSYHSDRQSDASYLTCNHSRISEVDLSIATLGSNDVNDPLQHYEQGYDEYRRPSFPCPELSSPKQTETAAVKLVNYAVLQRQSSPSKLPKYGLDAQANTTIDSNYMSYNSNNRPGTPGSRSRASSVHSCGNTSAIQQPPEQQLSSKSLASVTVPFIIIPNPVSPVPSAPPSQRPNTPVRRLDKESSNSSNICITNSGSGKGGDGGGGGSVRSVCNGSQSVLSSRRKKKDKKEKADKKPVPFSSSVPRF